MKYFTPQTDKTIDFSKVDAGALAMLEKAREAANIPFVITSHYRTPERSESVGGFKDDAHTKIPCSAFDIACTNSAARMKIVSALLAAGFTRIGINARNGHIHCDCDDTKPLGVLWVE